MRELVFPVVSLGSAGLKNPDVADVAEWIGNHTGMIVDITTYQIDRLFSQQVGVTEPAAGGEFYAARICSALGVEEHKIIQEFTLELEDIAGDFRFIPKKTVFSIPSFFSLGLEDTYFYDDDEFAENGMIAFKKLIREFRDRDVSRIILHAEEPTELELELLTGRKYLWKTSAEHVKSVLETTRDLVLATDDIGCLSELFDSYEIRNLYLLNATAESVSVALKFFDREYLFCTGYAPLDANETYWKNLLELKITVENC
ncbi:MAG TPA: hypothetical protein O0X32_03635 [Methanocorpusculum sp.]|nr:hypothetical protein [Methanocorpusculum sp.]